MTFHRFTVPGDPKGQPRPRAFYNKHTGRAAVYDPGTAEHWKSEIARAAKDAGLENLGFRGNVGLVCVYMFRRPRSHYRTGKNAHLIRETAPNEYHARTPDTDNIRKALKDTLKTIGTYYDDAQVCLDIDVSLWAGKSSYSSITLILDLRPGMWMDIFPNQQQTPKI